MEFLKWLRTQWDRVGATALAVLGLIVVLIGWSGAANTPHVAVQIPYFISGGLLGLFFLGAGGTLWLSADLRDEWRELRRLRELLEVEDAAPATTVNGRDRTVIEGVDEPEEAGIR